MERRKPTDARGSNGAGYKKPPREHRFKRGVSGNPRGRPRKGGTKPLESPPRHAGESLDDAVLCELMRAVPLEIDGQIRGVPAFQAVVRSLVEQAIAGDRMAARIVLGEAREAGERSRLGQEERRDLQESQIEIAGIISSLLTAAARRLKSNNEAHGDARDGGGGRSSSEPGDPEGWDLVGGRPREAPARDGDAPSPAIDGARGEGEDARLGRQHVPGGRDVFSPRPWGEPLIRPGPPPKTDRGRFE